MGELSLLGKIEITAAPSPTNPDVLSVYASCSTRDEVVHADTRPDENIDGFGLRIRGMLKGLYNAPLKKAMQDREKDDKKQAMMNSITGGKK